MLYYLYEYLTAHGIHIRYEFAEVYFLQSRVVYFNVPAIAMIYGKRIINFYAESKWGIGKRSGLEGQKQKEGTPTMGGLIIILATIVPVLLFTCMECVHRFAYCFYGLDGSNWFLDDYLKR